MKPRMIVLVTGAAGQIGRATLRLLRELEIEFRAVDLFPVPGVPSAHTCDLTDPASIPALAEYCRPVTHVVHLASRVTNSKDLAEAFAPQLRLEVVGTLNLLRALPSGVRHVAYASSMTVYGRPETLPVCETHRLRPHCIYALCKVAAERHLAEFSRARGVPVAALRIASVYGPGPSAGRAIPLMIQRALRGEPPEVYGNGGVQRDYIYVDDVCRAALAAAARGVNGPLNVGTGRGTTSAELAAAIARLARLDRPPVFIDRPLDEQASASLVFDISRLTALAQFSPSVTLEEGLARTMEYFRQDVAAKPEGTP